MQKVYIILSLALLVFIFTWPEATGDWSYPDILNHASMTLKGQDPFSDVAQDFYGFDAMITNKDPYAILGTGLKTIGVDWNVQHSSTHPPTAFLLVAPVAMLHWPLSSAVWAWLMLACLYLSFNKGIGYSWDISLFLTALALFWPPVIYSLGQITIVWLFGVSMAYRYRNRQPFLAGLFIGLASFSKLFPVLLLLPFLLRRKWVAIYGFTLSWLIAIMTIFSLSPNTFSRYLETNRTNSIEVIMRLDNGAFGAFLYRHAGVWGLITAAVVMLILLMLAYNLYQNESSNEISKEEWEIYSFMAVLCLPITWVYSLTPLIPNLLTKLQDKGVLVQSLTIGAIYFIIDKHPWEIESTYGLFWFFILFGSAIIFSSAVKNLSLKRMKCLQMG
jgi:uncharacterized membrane protein